jgi:predicted transcriptional regulator
LTCATECNVWRLKKNLRELRERAKDGYFLVDLFNTLKNKRRLQILQILSNRQKSIVSLQRELNKSGYHHSQLTIAEEYVNPLLDVGVIDEEHDKYRATFFGCKLSELIKDSNDIGELLPPHSECYEEKTIEALHGSPKTYEELRSLIPTESLSRILKRLKEANLITKGNENKYVFYFKTKRDPRKEKLSPTERRVHNEIPEEGIAAQELATRTNISLRRTYKYLRKLKGKKLAFKRKSPKTYTLTKKGTQIAKLLKKIHVLITEFTEASAEFSARPDETIQQIPALDKVLISN